MVGDIFNRGGVTFAPAICFSEFSVVKKKSITILTYLLPADAIYPVRRTILRPNSGKLLWEITRTIHEKTLKIPWLARSIPVSTFSAATRRVSLHPPPFSVHTVLFVTG